MLSLHALARQPKFTPKKGELDISSGPANGSVDARARQPNLSRSASPMHAPPVAPPFEGSFVVGQRRYRVNQTFRTPSPPPTRQRSPRFISVCLSSFRPTGNTTIPIRPLFGGFERSASAAIGTRGSKRETLTGLMGHRGPTLVLRDVPTPIGVAVDTRLATRTCHPAAHAGAGRNMLLAPLGARTSLVASPSGLPSRHGTSFEAALHRSTSSTLIEELHSS